MNEPPSFKICLENRYLFDISPSFIILCTGICLGFRQAIYLYVIQATIYQFLY